MPSNLFTDLERALSGGTDVQRMAMLARVTDLFIADAGRYSPEQINLFDALLSRFVSVIETAARAKLANRLAPVANAPAGVIRTLAFDDDIEVARPVLRVSERLDESDLIANANMKGQHHLLAISERKLLSEAVTDVLVARGDPEVVQTVAKNGGARFSYAGFRLLVRRANANDALAMQVGSRSDLPRQHMLRLLDEASAKVRASLLSQDPASGGVVTTVVEEVDSEIRREILNDQINYASARTKVEALHRAGQLNEAAVHQFARERRFEDTAFGLSLLCGVEISVVERALLTPGPEMLLILAKLAGFSWNAAQAILALKPAERRMSSQDIDKALTSFGRLNVGTARRVLGFYNNRSHGFLGSAS
jgi:uncharacterized protein (DUF2336 family)